MDAFTMEMCLCDDHGYADLDLLDWMRALGGHPVYAGDPFPCTGSAHLGGQHVRCTNPCHRVPTTAQPWLAERRRDAAHVAILAGETLAFLVDAPKDDPQVASLLVSAAAAERVAFRLYNEKPVALDDLVTRSIGSSTASY